MEPYYFNSNIKGFSREERFRDRSYQGRDFQGRNYTAKKKESSGREPWQRSRSKVEEFHRKDSSIQTRCHNIDRTKNKRKTEYRLNPRQINSKITKANSVNEILNVASNHHKNFDFINCSTFFHKLAKQRGDFRNLQSHKVFQFVRDLTIEKINDFESRNIASTALAFARLGIHDKELMTALSSEARRKIRGFNSQGIASTALAFATLGIHDERLMTALSGEAHHKVRGFNSQNIANTAWAFATLGIHDEELMTALSCEARHKVRGFNSQGIAITALAFATLGIHDERLMTALSCEGRDKVRGFNSQDIANIAWAFAVFGLNLPKTLFDKMIAGSESLDKIEYVQQYHQVMLVLRGSDDYPNKTKILKKLATSESPESSRTHQKISKCLKSNGFCVDNEYFVEGLFFDIYLKDYNLLIEVDGPSHFSSSGHYLGSSLIKNLIAKKLGFKLKRIKVSDWHERRSKILDEILV
ncbi:MAG: hypothetical protein K940chlam3_00078 [Chlamydiae bacterium]|nr:hypothetical protein [Chlamydiota bacterium]